MPNGSGLRPNNAKEYVACVISGKHMFTECAHCGDGFTKQNVHTALGWRETQISGICENCFDKLFDDDSEPEVM